MMVDGSASDRTIKRLERLSGSSNTDEVSSDSEGQDEGAGELEADVEQGA